MGYGIVAGVIVLVGEVCVGCVGGRGCVGGWSLFGCVGGFSCCWWVQWLGSVVGIGGGGGGATQKLHPARAGWEKAPRTRTRVEHGTLPVRGERSHASQPLRHGGAF